MSKIKWLIGAVAVIVVIAIIVNVVVPAFSSSEETVMTTMYMEETVAVGDIVVGLSESGTSGMLTTEVSYDFAVTVEEYYVASGQYVEEGEVLATVNTEDFQELYLEAEEAYESALLSYNNTSISVESQKMSALSTYNTTVYYGEYAEEIYNMDIVDLENSYGILLLNISDAENTKTGYETMLSTTLAENYDTTALEATLSSYKSQLTSVNSQISTADTSISSASGGTTVTALEALYLEKSDLENKISETESTIASYESSYDSEYSKYAGLLSDATVSLNLLYADQTSYENAMVLSRMNSESDLLDSQYEYNTAEATYDNTIAQLDSELDDVATNLEEAKEYLDELSVLSTDSTVIAPCSGFIMYIMEEDVTYSGGVALVTIADRDTVEVEVSVAQEDVSTITVGMDANILFDAYEDVLVASTVSSISIIPSSGMASSVYYTITLTCDLTQYEDVIIYQSMTGTVTFIQRQSENALVISSKCVFTEDDKEYVLVKRDDGTVEQVEIVTGFSDGFDVEITQGLEEGDVVIIESAVSSYAN
ncbi:MAG: HlyD family efflux transporter periplasmic adaptor subunit [Lachnospiraceae bacterium]